MIFILILVCGFHLRPVVGAFALFSVPAQETVATPVEVTKPEMKWTISAEPYSTHCYFTSKKANN